MSGHCVAGKELLPDGRPGQWLRPVGARETGEVSLTERQYADGGEPRLLDIIDVPLLNPCPQGHQRENWRLDPNHRWAKAGRISWNDLERMTDPDAPLWTKPDQRNDRVTAAANTFGDSLRLIKVDQLTVTVSEPPRPSSLYPVLRGRFHYCGADYALRITDPQLEISSMELPYGDYRVGSRYLTVSLGEPFEGYAYKLIAAIIKKP